MAAIDKHLVYLTVVQKVEGKPLGLETSGVGDRTNNPRIVRLSCLPLCNSCYYRKVPKFSDARKLCCNLPITQTKRPNLRVFCQNGANGIATVKTPIRLLLEEQSDLGLHYLPIPICPKTWGHYVNSSK